MRIIRIDTLRPTRKLTSATNEDIDWDELDDTEENQKYIDKLYESTISAQAEKIVRESFNNTNDFDPLLHTLLLIPAESRKLITTVEQAFDDNEDPIPPRTQKIAGLSLKLLFSLTFNKTFSEIRKFINPNQEYLITPSRQDLIIKHIDKILMELGYIGPNTNKPSIQPNLEELSAKAKNIATKLVNESTNKYDSYERLARTIDLNTRRNMSSFFRNVLQMKNTELLISIFKPMTFNEEAFRFVYPFEGITYELSEENKQLLKRFINEELMAKNIIGPNAT